MSIKRIEKVQNLLNVLDIDFLIIEDEISLFYLTSMHVEGKLIIAKNIARLFVDKRYLEEAEKKSSCPVFLNEEDLIADFFLVHCKNGKVAIDSKYTNVCSYQKLQKFLDVLQKKGSRDILFKIIFLEDSLKEIRAIKTQDEIYALQKAANITWMGFEHICSLLKENISEKALATEFKIFCLKNGADKLAFEPIICFGANSSLVHHSPTLATLKKDDVVLIDIGASFQGYSADMTRTIFFGVPDPVLENFYSIVRKAQRAALNLCKEGAKVKDIDKAARDFIAKEGFGENFVHSLGHGVGLEVHEFPILKQKEDTILKAGMVVTIEPGIYKKGIGGVRYEDTILITKDGFENFYTSL